MPKVKREPWLNESTHFMRHQCWKEQRKWKKNMLLITLQILKVFFRPYWNVVREARRNYLSNVILSARHKPNELLSVVVHVLNVPQSTYIEPSTELCESFFTLFVDKVASIRAQLPPVPQSSYFWSLFCTFESF